VTAQAFIRINGVGQHKLVRYAERFINEIQNFLDMTELM